MSDEAGAQGDPTWRERERERLAEQLAVAYGMDMEEARGHIARLTTPSLVDLLSPEKRTGECPCDGKDCVC